MPTIPVELRLGAELKAALPDVGQRLAALGAALQRDLGIDFPAAQAVEDTAAAGGGYMVLVDHLPAGRGELPPGELLVRGAEMDVDLLGLPYVQRPGETASDPQEIWVEAGGAEALAKAELTALAAGEVLMERVAATLRRNAAQFVGIQEAKNLLARMEAASYEDLVREANRAVPLQRFTEVLKRLLDEQVSVSNLRLVLEALVEWGPKEQDPSLLAEYVRGSLKRQISHAHADREKLIAAVLLQRETEDVLRNALRKTAVGTYLALSDADTLILLEQVRAKRPAPQFGNPAVVILTSLDIRRYLRGFLVRNDIDVPVLSFQDIAPDYVVRPIATIAIKEAGAGTPDGTIPAHDQPRLAAAPVAA
jgi:type III secretion protein V